MSKKPPSWYNQSGVIPFRRKGCQVEVLLVTSSSQKRWIIPKGIVEPDLSPAESAAQEALEEAGVTGVVGTEPIGEYHYDKWGGTCIVAVYLLEVREVLETWQEGALRRREWLSLADAQDRLSDQGLKRVFEALTPSDFTQPEHS